MRSKQGDDYVHFRNAIIEHYFEQQRVRMNPQLPRRTSSVHVFRDLDGARSFRSEFRASDSPIYEARATRVTNVHHSWTEWTNATPITPGSDLDAQLAALASAGAAYWRGDAPGDAVRSETLIQGVVRIGALVDAGSARSPIPPASRGDEEND